MQLQVRMLRQVHISNTYNPDVVLIHIGTNDAKDDGTYSPSDINASVSNVSNILTLIKNANPNVIIIIARIIQEHPSLQWITDYNNSLAIMVNGRNDPQHLFIVDMENALNSDGSDLVDGIHPANSGKQKIANIWYTALQTILSTTSGSPSINTSAPTVAYAGLSYRYDVNVDNTAAPPDYSLTTFPSGMVINKKTGIIDWTPGNGDQGIHAVSVTAGSSVQNYNLYVFPPLTSLNNNLISYWRMGKYVNNGLQNTFKDFLGINNGQSDINVTASNGISGYGVTFNGNTISNNESIKVLDDSTFYFNNSQSFSIEVWVKTSSTNGAFLGKYRAASQMGYYLGVNSNGKAIFYVKDNDTYSGGTKTHSAVSASVVSSSIINDNNWHHVVGVFDRSSAPNTTLRLYVDGSQVNTALGTYYGDFFSYDPLTMGSYANINFFNGSLDEVAIYNGVLPLSDIQAHYTRGNTYAEGYFDINARIKVLLQGPYAGGGLMNTTLNPNYYTTFTTI